MSDTMAHDPVMLTEMLHYMAPKSGEHVVDATFGAGGYSRALLESAPCHVTAIDRDATLLPYVEAVRALYHDNFTFIPGTYREVLRTMKEKGEMIDAIVFDVGVSSMQLDQAERGFSFRENGPLDMRMGDNARDASWFINHAKEEEIADTLFYYGGERRSRAIARRIVIRREKEPYQTTHQLANTVYSVLGRRKVGGIDPATRSFQAIRIWVNDELSELEEGLSLALSLLRPNGRIVVVTFHSLEDRIVKQFFKEKHQEKTLELLLKKPLEPSPDECNNNHRARSAKLRAALKI